MTPDFHAKITLYPTNQGGRQSAIVGGWCGEDSWFGCPCKVHPNDFSGWDCRILNGLESLEPGEAKAFGIVFLSREIAPAMQMLPKFYLWEGRIIGEATSLL